MPFALSGNRRMSFLPYSPTHPSWLTSARRDHLQVSLRSLPLSYGISPLRKTNLRSGSTMMAWLSVFWVKTHVPNREGKIISDSDQGFGQVSATRSRG